MIRYGLPLLALRQSVAQPYRSPNTFRPTRPPRRDRVPHADDLLRSLESLAREIADQRTVAPGTTAAIVAVDGPNLNDAAVDLDSVGRVLAFDVERNVAVLRVEDDGRRLAEKVEDYRVRNTRRGNPVNRNLVDRVDGFRLASLADLSLGEIDESSIAPNSFYWVEIWVPNGGDPQGSAFRDSRAEVDALASLVSEPDRVPVAVGPERNVYLVRITGELLLAIPVLLAGVVVEVHLAQAIRLIEIAERSDSLGLDVAINEPPIEANAVAIHDTGVRSMHPYIARALLGSASAVPGVDGEDRHGHGTEMSGLAIYQNLAESVVAGSVTPEHWIIGVRLLDDAPDGVELWAERQSLAVQLAESYGVGRHIVHNISIGASNPQPGRRTSWSIAVDSEVWNKGEGRLFVVAAGNARPILDARLYPSTNLADVHDQPAQAWNALTVGAITNLDSLSPEDVALGAPPPVASAGQLSPYTSLGPPGNLPIKPEVVMEGGNSAPGAGLAGTGLQGLSLLTTGFRSRGLLERTWATSAAAARASFALARLASMHPGLRPATIRGLFVHSAKWPEAALRQLDKKDVLRAIGYGQSDEARMGTSDSNRVVLVYEGEAVGAASSEARTATFVRLPLPDFETLGYGETTVRLAVTLSYFIDPTDNLTRRYYAGARLRWDMQGPLEEEEGFIQRANAATRTESYSSDGPGSFSWTVKITARSRGTLQHDWTILPASLISGERLIAIQPVLGWWSERETYADKAIPFSLVVSADFGDADVDLHVLVEDLIATTTSVEAT